MVFTEPLTWKCHICGQERPDSKISVVTKPLVINGAVCGEQNIRYCNDKAECIEGAQHKDLFKCRCPYCDETIETGILTCPKCGGQISWLKEGSPGSGRYA